MVRLPLQASLFDEIGSVGEILGVADMLPDGRFGALLDPEGNLFLDRSHVRTVSQALAERLSPALVLDAEERLRRACLAVVRATDKARSLAPGLDEAEARELAALVGRCVAALLPYPIMTKFVPEVLLRALGAEGDHSPLPFTGPSPGAKLTDALFALNGRCQALGFAPDRIAAAWPSVPPEVWKTLHAFCQRHAGFGPVAWEGPGFETPEYVIAMMRTVFGGSDPAPRRGGLGDAVGSDGRDRPSTALTTAVRKALGTWLEFLDMQIWYVRSAFYRGMLPLLRRIAALSEDRLHRSEDLLFVRWDEVAAGRTDLGLIEERRRTYLGDTEYLERIGADADRLALVMKAL